MSQDANFYILIASATLFAMILTAYTVVRIWNEWIGFKRAELNQQFDGEPQSELSPISRIEVADLKERVKKLEAIAAGIDL